MSSPELPSQMGVPNGHTKLQEVTPDTPLDEVFQKWEEDGGVIIKGILAPAQVTQLREELQPLLDTFQRGSTTDIEPLKRFHGSQTKRAGGLTNCSAIFRDYLLDNDFLHAIAARCFGSGGRPGVHAYWISSANTINVGPVNRHKSSIGPRKLPHYHLLGPDGPESQATFLIATTDFTDANGATRIIPGSQKWPFNQTWNPSQSIPSEMHAGDCLLFGGKVVHGTGANTTNAERGCVAFTFCANHLTPEEAHPHIVDINIVRKLSERAQRSLGFRSQYPRGAPGLWMEGYNEVATRLGLDSK
uniref:Phytanoyl-CoA dioxygenase n=1 Tax=Alternaria alternata TaxID=5599 RepID=A0A3G9HRC6_ALTAL|nr:phytanoyl-CoA dioxygenase [Alternaria alternata]